MKKLNEEEIKQFNNSEDFELVSTYYRFLMQYIDRRVHIKQYDEMFNNSPLNYIAVAENDMDVYQYLFSDEYNYLYIRNNLYLDNLVPAELQFLRLKANAEYDDEIDRFIGNTLKRVLKNPKFGDLQIPMGTNIPRFMVNNGTLVIGFRYDEYNMGGMNDVEWDKRHEDQIGDCFQKMLSLEQDVRKELKINCSVIQYNEYSVTKKESGSYIK